LSGAGFPAKVYLLARKGYQQDALFAGNKVELSPVNNLPVQ